MLKRLKTEAKAVRQATQKALDDYRERNPEGDPSFVPTNYRRSFDTADSMEKTARAIAEQIKKVEGNDTTRANDPLGLRVALEALDVWSDPKQGSRFDPRKAGQATCNAFVEKVMVDAGILPPRRLGLNGIGPKGSTEWHMPVKFAGRDKERGGTVEFSPVAFRKGGQDDAPDVQPAQMGGVISYPHHVAIHLGSGLTIGATQARPHGQPSNAVSIIQENTMQDRLYFNVYAPNR